MALTNSKVLKNLKKIYQNPHEKYRSENLKKMKNITKGLYKIKNTFNPKQKKVLKNLNQMEEFSKNLRF